MQPNLPSDSWRWRCVLPAGAHDDIGSEEGLESSVGGESVCSDLMHCTGQGRCILWALQIGMRIVKVYPCRMDFNA